MSDEEVKLTPAEENPWYQLALKSREHEADPARLWNGYQRHLLECLGMDVPEGLEGKLPTLQTEVIEKIDFNFPTLKQLIMPGEDLVKTILDFSRNNFESEASFKAFVFAFNVSFASAKFCHSADFSRATFSRMTAFQQTKFRSQVKFELATFSRSISFTKAKFEGTAFFHETQFCGGVDFRQTEFVRYAYFRGTTFSGSAHFGHALFKGPTYFTVGHDAKPTGPMTFYAAKFLTRPPEFYQRELHQNTDWTNAEWPEPSDDRHSLEQDIRAYERLRLIAKDQGSLAQEYIFFREEMACKTKLRRKTGRYGAALLYSAYGLFRYGHSLTAPLVWLGANVFAGATLHNSSANQMNDFKDLGHSFANTFPFLRVTPRRDYWETVPDWLIAVAGLQSAVGLILLFLFGLALRAALRMR